MRCALARSAPKEGCCRERRDRECFWCELATARARRVVARDEFRVDLPGSRVVSARRTTPDQVDLRIAVPVIVLENAELDFVTLGFARLGVGVQERRNDADDRLGGPSAIGQETADDASHRDAR